MSGHRIFRIARADFRERTRSQWFLAIVATVAYLGSAVTRGTIKISFQGGYGPVKDAEWLGATTAMTAAFLSLLAGFYISRGGITNDREQGLGPHIAASAVRDREYVLAKWCSGVALQWLLFVLLLIAAVVTGLVIDAGGLSLQSLLVPIVVLAFPLSLPVAAVAVLFETNRYLDTSFGTATYTLGVLFLLSVVPIMTLFSTPPTWVLGLDLIGFAPIVDSMTEALQAQYPNYDGMPSFGVGGAPIEQTFRWDGVRWTVPFLVARVGIAAVAAPVLGLAVVSFGRFDVTSSEGDSPTAKTAKTDETTAVDGEDSVPSLTFGEGGDTRLRWRRLLGGELRLALAGQSRLWWGGALGLLVTGLLVPSSVGRALVLPVAAIWPLPVWSKLGVRERREHVTPFVYTSTSPVAKIIATWGSGVVVTLGILAGVGVRVIVAGRPELAVGLVAAAVCFPAVALALGIATGSPRPFEGLLLVVWYAGSLNGFAPLDVLVTTDEALQAGAPFVALGVGVLVLGATIAVRARRVGRLPTGG